MVLPFCTALDPDILKGGGMTCACLLTVRKCIQTKKIILKQVIYLFLPFSIFLFRFFALFHYFIIQFSIQSSFALKNHEVYFVFLLLNRWNNKCFDCGIPICREIHTSLHNTCLFPMDISIRQLHVNFGYIFLECDQI